MAETTYTINLKQLLQKSMASTYYYLISESLF